MSADANMLRVGRARERGRLAASVAVCLLCWSCAPEEVPEPYRPTNAHDAYRNGLARAALIHTALGADWLRAADAALESPTRIETPFTESAFVEPSRATARGYRFRVSRGQRVEVAINAKSEQPVRLFIDLFRVPAKETAPLQHVASAGEGDRRLWFEPRANAEYVLRVQPELLREAQVSIEIRNVRSLAFPVEGYETDSIGSGFGAPREAGRRTHHGVDIFARRHTPVVATSEAVVRRVDDWRLGGRIIWLWDETRKLRLYYAHLQSQDVVEGQKVSPGDRIGTVGNSGNARTTPPHLHFGVYAAGVGPLNPLPFIHQPRQNPPRIMGDDDLVGTWVRTRSDQTPYHDDPRGELELRRISRHTPLFVSAASRSSFRVRLPNGMEGYLAASAVESLTTPITAKEITHSVSLRARPNVNSPIVGELDPGTRVEILGRSESFSLVRQGASARGWLVDE